MKSDSLSAPFKAKTLLQLSCPCRQFDKHSNLHNAAEEALKPCLAGMALSCVCTSAHQHQIAHRLHAYLWLFETYVIPAG
eukprot:319422-Pelagomonas_calceolata.AAC.1